MERPNSKYVDGIVPEKALPENLLLIHHESKATEKSEWSNKINVTEDT